MPLRLFRQAPNAALPTLALAALLLTAASALGQTPPAAVGYHGQVLTEGMSRPRLFQRAQDWLDNRFAFGPKTEQQADAAAGTLRVTGTSKLTLAPPSAGGKEQSRVVRFTFQFHLTEQGYEYDISNFYVFPDPRTPAVTVPLDDFIMQQSKDWTGSQSVNGRRVRAQATSIASEVATQFRSYMNGVTSEQ